MKTTGKKNTKPKSETKTQAIPSTIPAPSTGLPEGYFADGSMMFPNGIYRSEYFIEYPKQLADLLRPMTAATFYTAFLENAGRFQLASLEDTNLGDTNLEENDPFGDPLWNEQMCAMDMLVEAIMLVRQKRAPAILLPMMKAATATVQDLKSFDALCLHLSAIHSYLLECEGGEPL